MRRPRFIWLICSLCALTLASGQGATFLTNTFPPVPGQFGTVLAGQQFTPFEPAPEEILLPLPGSSPAAVLAGQPEQWRFYVITNDPGFTNAAFVLFDYADLSGSGVPGDGADIDLYVSQDAALLDLDPAAFASAWRSTGPGTDDLVQLQDALAGAYYIALKCESHRGGEAGLAVLFNEEPFSSAEADGRIILKALPSPSQIPQASQAAPEEGLVFGIPPDGAMLRRVVVTNCVSHPAPGQLRTSLMHRGETILLRDFSSFDGEEAVFDDSAEGDLPGTLPCASPSGLTRWNGYSTSGAWIVRHESQGTAATNESTEIWLYPQTDSPATILPAGERWEYFQAPANITNVLLSLSMTSGDGPLWVEASPASRNDVGFNQLLLHGTGSGSMEIDAWSDPPVQPGLWRVRLRNDGLEPAVVHLAHAYQQRHGPETLSCTRLGSPVEIQDHTNITVSIPVTNTNVIRSMEVGLRANHPRIGDLEFTLISPSGTRTLLQSQRGGASTNGLGSDIMVTNFFPVSSSGGPVAASNRINLKRTSGVISVFYEFYGIPDWMKIFYETNLIFDTGLAEGNGQTNIAFGPGETTAITIVVNEGDNTDPDTAWFYSISASYPDFSFFSFSDDPANPPVKFALPPFCSSTPNAGSRIVMPEVPLSAFAGESAGGVWKLEIEDAYAGPEPACGELVEAQLGFRLRNDTPLPVRLQDGVPVELSLAPLQTKWFEVNSFVWTERIASCIVTSDTPVSLLFSDVLPEPGAPPPTTLLADSQNGCFELSNVSSPPVAPGAKFYLALQNAGSSFVQASIQVNETPVVRTLITRTPQFESSLQPGAADYYTFNVLESAERLQFRLSGLSDNADLFVRKGLPLPDATNALASGQSPGTAEEWIVLRPTESMALSGTWFAAVVNMGEAPVGYTIEAIQSIESGTPITASTAVAGGNQVCVRWTSVPGAGYHVLGCTNLPAAEWSVVSDRIIADDIETTHCLPVTQTQEYFRISEVVGYD